jgi:hypothetical protein
MFDYRDEIASKPFHPEAESLALSHIGRFATVLLWQAKVVAAREKAEIVLSTHVNNAVDNIVQDKGRWRQRELAIAVAGALFGGGFEGFASELAQSSLHAGWLGLYALVGVAGLGLLFWALGWKRWPPQQFSGRAPR